MTYDVAILGGGPAGSTAANLLAQSGRRVVVLERERFPRFHIGESLLPFSMDALDRLGVTQRLADAGFVVKHGAEISSGCGTCETRFYFKDGFRSRRGTALQVERATFDHILLERARECGAEVREETSVTDLNLDGDCAEITVDSGRGPETVSARYVVDCTGRNSLIGSKLGLKKEYPNLQKFAVYAHFEGAAQPEGVDGTLTRMVRTPQEWFWMIPLSREKVSVGVVMDTAAFRARRQSPEEVLAHFLREQPVMRERLTGARRVTKVYASGDYSYRNETFYGRNWLLAGDAAGFIDPIFSSGVFLAILGGERAADALLAALDEPAGAPAAFRRYERHLEKVMNLYLRFVQSWYRQEFVETLLAPREFFQVVPAVNAVLAGNMGQSFALRWRLWLFHTIVRLQKVFPICPRLALAPPAP
jgi:geranylgeranyl reductase family protein